MKNARLHSWMCHAALALHLSFLAEKAALRATVTFVRPGPLGLQLEPATGNPVRPAYLGHLYHGRLSPLLLAVSSSSLFGYIALADFFCIQLLPMIVNAFASAICD